ncbi:uncharacterized protein LOC114576192 [Exaiptasia diaphana]|uniref:Uncharacterized protein n=1 Tax=Exaiptasia diaphana TaxID=2652724 RepID=A0A913YT25_EXADI|nr:uncharacterized protein LOC114576192 [Exaiptasia diaphana]
MQIMGHDDPQTVIHMLASETILTSLPENLSVIERIRTVFRKEVMATAIKGRYSGLLQVQMASNFLGTPVSMHCTEPGCESYNKTIQPRKTTAGPAVNILWCKLTDDAKAINHFAPLIHCPESRIKFNTFHHIEKNAAFQCPCCQFLDDVIEEVVQCQFCLVWYHRKCVEFSSVTRQQRQFACGCASNIDQQWIADIKNDKVLRRIYKNNLLTDYLKEILSGTLPSRRLSLFLKDFQSNTARSLRVLNR